MSVIERSLARSAHRALVVPFTTGWPIGGSSRAKRFLRSRSGHSDCRAKPLSPQSLVVPLLSRFGRRRRTTLPEAVSVRDRGTRAGGHPRRRHALGRCADHLRQRRLRGDHRLCAGGGGREELPVPARERPPATGNRHDARGAGRRHGDPDPAAQLPQGRQPVLERPPSRPGPRCRRARPPTTSASSAT